MLWKTFYKFNRNTIAITYLINKGKLNSIHC
jgi:hypothetical protein